MFRFSQGTKGETLKGTLGLYRGFMRRYKGYIRVLLSLNLEPLRFRV